MVVISEKQLNLYQSLFRGRNDIYAKRWEKNGKSGYGPAYQFDWNQFLTHKNTGGTMASFEHKTALPLTHDVIKKHLIGQYVIGIYPLLENDTSFFIVADLDGAKALEDASVLIRTCGEFGLPAYLERSRSGNGAHVWMFFEEPYPAIRSRVILLECVSKALNLSAFDKEVSFDRIFPNQDVHSGKGVGNLIALPLQGVSIIHGDTMFLDPKTLNPYPDQWIFLESIQRISTEILEEALFKITKGESIQIGSASEANKILINLNNGIRIQKSLLDKVTVNFLREELNFPNLDYWLKKRLGKSVYQTEKFFRLIEEDGADIVLPRGFLVSFINHLRTRGIGFEIRDQRILLPKVSYSSVIKLHQNQAEIIEQATHTDQGVIIAPPGSGKTVMGLEIIARRSQPALILTHRKQIMDQWIDRIQSFLGITKAHIGRVDGVKKAIGEKITVAMMQSLARMEDLAELSNKFGLVIVDECHHIPAKTFREVVSNINARYWYGLTATPDRKHKDEKLIYLFIGDVITEMKETIEAGSEKLRNKKSVQKRQIIVRKTAIEIPFSFTTDNYQILARIISFDQSRNKLVLEDIKTSVNSGQKTLVLSERKEHLELLNMCLKGCCETIMVTGDDSAASRKSKLAQITSGQYQVILATGQLLGEGMDLPDIDVLILAFPIAFEGKIIQYIGRIRGEKKLIYDYHDSKTPFLARQFKKRKRCYEKIGFDVIES